MRWLDASIEEQIQTAIREGQFDDLRGQGKPLHLDDDSDEFWLANHILREAGVLPEWLELRKQIDAERPAVREALNEYRETAASLPPELPGRQAILERLEERYVNAARKVNAKIDLHNIRCPSIRLELARFQEDLISRERAKGRGY